MIHAAGVLRTRPWRESQDGFTRHALRCLTRHAHPHTFVIMSLRTPHTLTCTMCMCHVTDQWVREGSGVRM